MEVNGKNNTEIKGIQMNECFDSGSCGQCHWFDGNYHDGYCNKHRIDVDSYQSSCGDFWRE